jgi:urease accessory protein UreF
MGTAMAHDIGSGALYRLMAWLSPAYPVGAFSYSGGIEWAVEAGDIRDAESLRAWLAVVIGEGGGCCDAVFFVHAYRSLAGRRFRPVQGASSGDHGARRRLHRGDAGGLALRRAR